MPVILKMTPIGKRASLISDDEAKKMLDSGSAILCPGYEILEEVTSDEAKQGYMTRNMAPLPKRTTRPPKVPAAEPTGK